MSQHTIHRLTVVAVLVPILGFIGQANAESPIEPRLAGRAVLPVDTYAAGPPSGAALVPAGQTSTTINGILFPTPSQPVEGFSALLPGRHPGELLAMPDNGFGGKANSQDFLIRAYYIAPDYRTASHGSGTIVVGDFIQFADPDALIGFPIVRGGTPERWLTGGDIDPESVQRGKDGELWVGDEFGPWILHFDARGRLLEPPIALPDGLVSPNNPHRTGPATVANSRGIEAMAITPDRQRLIVVLEGAVPGDDPLSRRVYAYDISSATFTRHADYRVEVAGHFVSDAQSLDGAHLAVIERDGGFGRNANFRGVYSIEFGPGQGKGLGGKLQLVDLAAIRDPDLISLPELHPGDVGLGDPFRVTCESIEALLVESHARLVLGCDNNFPNRGRNLTLADDNELIVVEAPGL